MKKFRYTFYDIFRTKARNSKDASLNEIMKNTKSLLASRREYESYIHNYFSSTKLSTFKSPEITEYPVLKADSSILIPISTPKFKEKEKIKIFNKGQLLLGSEIFKKNSNNFLEDFNKRLNRIVKYNEEIKFNKTCPNKKQTKQNERYNSLFQDFFTKWKSYNKEINLKYALTQDKELDVKIKNENSLFNFNIKERYSGLHYNENEIFNTNYDKFISNQINYVKKNKIKNYISEIKSSFLDSNERKIKLKLESIKLIFSPKKEQNGYKQFYIFIPLSYVFLFYSYDFSFFQKMLMSLLKFETNYKSINFKNEGFIDLLNSLNNCQNKQNEDTEEDLLLKFKKGKHTEEIKLSNNNKNEFQDMRKTFNKPSYFYNKFMRKTSNIYGKKEIKTKIIHSNKNFSKIKINEEENKDNRDNNKMIYSNNNKNDVLYNEYYFVWETSGVTYDVKMEMPKIYFSYQNYNYNIIAFCEKKLFLYLYKNNFINWDFYALNYLFSFKLFRKIITNIFAFNKNEKLIKNKIFTNLKKMKSPFAKTWNKLNLIEEDNNSSDEIDQKKDIIISNKKVLNQMSENNEFYMFFYTDRNYDNYIMNLYSYKIKIEHEKINPALKWEFILNFKQMKFLNEVSKYENLITFLPKIIRTNYEIGDLDINFDVFYNNFNAKILQNEEGHNPPKKKHLKIEILKPFIASEKIGGINGKKFEKELNDNLLQNLNKIKMANWSRKILALMKKDLLFKSYRASDMYTNKFKFRQKSPQKDDIIKKSVNKTYKKKLTFYGVYKNQNLDI